MRIARWSLALSTLLFITSVGFVLTASRRSKPARAAAPVFATVRQLMLGLVIPTSNAIYQAAGTVSTLEGTVDKAPANDREWEIVAANAAVLIEASHLLQSEGRAMPDQVGTDAAAAMEAGSRSVLAAARAKNVDDLLEKGGEIVAACDSCHKKFAPVVR